MFTILDQIRWEFQAQHAKVMIEHKEEVRRVFLVAVHPAEFCAVRRDSQPFKDVEFDGDEGCIIAGYGVRIVPRAGVPRFHMHLHFTDKKGEAVCAPFLTEQVVAEAKAAGFPPPPDGRAWGAVIQRAHRAHQIEKVGYAAAATSNCSPKVLWRSKL